MGRTVEEGAGDRFVVEGVEGVGFGNKDGSFLNKRRGRRTPRSYQEFLITIIIRKLGLSGKSVSRFRAADGAVSVRGP